MPSLVAAATATLAPAQASTGGGIVTMARQVGLALGVSLLVTIVDGVDPRSWLHPSLVRSGAGHAPCGAHRPAHVQRDN
jgi:hypothetical protein